MKKVTRRAAGVARWRRVTSSRAASIFAKVGSLFVLVGMIAVVILVVLLTRKNR